MRPSARSRPPRATRTRPRTRKKRKPPASAARRPKQQLAEAEKKKEGLTQYYEVELDRKSVHLTHEGIAAAQDAAGVGSFYVGNNMEWPHLMEQSLRAHVVYEKDKDYVVERGRRRGEMEVIIVDEYTGRKMVGRQWSRRPAPGGRSQGTRADQAGDADAGDDHAAELLQALQGARRA